ncbi:MAG: SpoIIE family protein phosphatase, partial [Planctomycetota bacterium]
MAATILTILGHGQTRQVELNPKGTVIGRSAQCDVVLECEDVSRKHARMFRDPFGRWIIEDLGSRNGVVINGEPVEAYAVLPGESISIGSFSLSIESSLAEQIKPDVSPQVTASTIVDYFETEIVSDRSQPAKALSRSCLKQLNEINEQLSKLTSPSALYPEVCRALAQTPQTAALVLRLPEKTEPLPQSPQIITCCLGDNPDDATAQDGTDLHLSRRTLEAVRSTGNAVMATSTRSSGADVFLTISDEHRPRAVICAPLSAVTEVVDVLYLDILIDQTTPEIFEFVQAIARQVISVRKSLIFMQAKAEREVLDQQLSLAHDIQSKLMPSEVGPRFGVDMAVCYKPAMWVGGDYCDVWSLENGQIAFAVADVSGKGLPAAMIMSNLQATLRTTMAFCTELSSVAQHVNRHLCQNLRDDMFVALFLGLFDPSENRLTYVNAGHLPPLIMRPSEPARPLDIANSPPLGIVESPLEKVVEVIPSGSTLVVFTDGITEARSPDGELFEM